MEVIIDNKKDNMVDRFDEVLDELLICWNSYCKSLKFNLQNSHDMLESSEKTLQRSIKRGNENAIKRNELQVKKSKRKYTKYKELSELVQIFNEMISNNTFTIKEDTCYSFSSDTYIPSVVLIFKEYDYYFRRYDDVDLFPDKGMLCKGIDELYTSSI